MVSTGFVMARTAKTKRATRRRRGTPAPKRSSAKPMPPVVHRFGPGNPGKPKGAKNKFGVKLKEAILEAAEKSGRDGKGKDGAVGYLVWLSRAEPAVFGRMLEKVMPLQIDVKDDRKTYTPAEAKAALESRGLPVPQSLSDLALHATIEQAIQEDVSEDNSEFDELAPDTPEIYASDEEEDEEDLDSGEDGPGEEEAA